MGQASHGNLDKLEVKKGSPVRRTSGVVEAENVVEDEEAASGHGEQVEHLAELEHMILAGQLQVAADEHHHAALRARGLAVDGGDVVLALLER